MVIHETSKSTNRMNADLLVSPRDIAKAIGASESSLRRWIDSGDIRISRTAGGHRRVPLRDAVQFIRKIGAVVVRPEALHLPALEAAEGSADTSAAGRSDEDALFTALTEGQRELANGLMLTWYLRGRALHELFDGPVRSAMQRVGELWKHEDRGILVEHRATEICLGMVAHARSLLPVPAEAPSTPLAIGAAPEGDPYRIPSMMAGTVLAEAGFLEVNYGANTPLNLLAREASLMGAKLVWLSVSAVADAKALHGQVSTLAASLAERNTRLVIGGHASGEMLRRAIPNAHLIRSMGELAAFAKGLHVGKTS
jgi:hypothetical protein